MVVFHEIIQNGVGAVGRKGAVQRIGAHAVRMARDHDAVHIFRVFIIPEELREHINFLHECRNLLAHTNICTINQVAGLIGAE